MKRILTCFITICMLFTIFTPSILAVDNTGKYQEIHKKIDLKGKTPNEIKAVFENNNLEYDPNSTYNNIEIIEYHENKSFLGNLLRSMNLSSTPAPKRKIVFERSNNVFSTPSEKIDFSDVLKNNAEQFATDVANIILGHFKKYVWIPATLFQGIFGTIYSSITDVQGTYYISSAKVHATIAKNYTTACYQYLIHGTYETLAETTKIEATPTLLIYTEKNGHLEGTPEVVTASPEYFYDKFYNQGSKIIEVADSCYYDYLETGHYSRVIDYGAEEGFIDYVNGTYKN